MASSGVQLVPIFPGGGDLIQTGGIFGTLLQTAGIHLLGYQTKDPEPQCDSGSKKFRRRPTLPHSCPCSTIGAEGLNFRVRDGNGCFPFAIATENL